MAKGKKTGGKDFVLGDPRAGRPRTPIELKGLRSLSKAEASAALAEALKLNLVELEELVKDRTLPALNQWAARIVLMGMKQGDSQRLNFMLDRLVGKVTEKVEHKIIEPFIIDYPDGSREVLGATIKDKEEE